MEESNGRQGNGQKTAVDERARDLGDHHAAKSEGTDQRIPHEEERRGWFDEAAEKSSNVISGAPFFYVSVLLLILWLPLLWWMKPEPAQFLLQTVIAVVTLLLVALLQNSQKRSEDAVNLKLDAIAQGVADLMRHHTGEDKDLKDNIEQLMKSVGLEERLSAPHNREEASEN
jgi:low affinity Fe/Cu permease